MKSDKNIVSLKLFIGGREVTRANWHKFGPGVSEDRLDAFAHSIYDAVGPLSCASHGKKARVECHGESLSDIGFRVTTCCETFQARVSRALAAIRPTKMRGRPRA